MGRYGRKTCYVCGYQDTADRMVRKEYKRKRGETKDSIHGGTWVGLLLGDKRSANRINKSFFANNKRSHYTNTPVWQCLECSGEGSKIRAIEEKRLRKEQEAKELEEKRLRKESEEKAFAEYERLNPPGPIKRFFRGIKTVVDTIYRLSLAMIGIVVALAIYQMIFGSDTIDQSKIVPNNPESHYEP